MTRPRRTLPAGPRSFPGRLRHQSPAAQGAPAANTGSGSGSSAAKGSHTASRTGTGTGKDTTGRASGSGTGHGTTSTTPVLCNGANTQVTAQVVSRPLDHMLITVKNTGSRPCDLTYFPFLRFDEMQWAPGAFEESRPQAGSPRTPRAGPATRACDSPPPTAAERTEPRATN
ncbi:DUF4232 domain-containing protein [Streptomyces sp. CA-106131]|uniref:DUF4232 domain-containing protein n=1 Tax=Streptomyces sp. CA-106131 TaxID=3240045 RepID=UPI003D919206